MKYPWIDNYLLSKAGVRKNLENWNWVRYQLGGKMFAAVCLDEQNKPYYITLKLEPAEGDFLRQQYKDIVPGYYMNKIHWNSVNPDGEVPDDLLKDLLDKSYRLVLESFSKKKQQEILAGTLPIRGLSCCGTDCKTCGCYPDMCKGCDYHLGKVFHAPNGQACPIYECAVNGKQYENCASCDRIPCDIWRKTKDPSFSDEEFEQNITNRINNLKNKK